MRTTTPGRCKSIRLSATAFVLIAAGPLPAQTRADVPRLAVSATAGFGRSLNGQFRDNYGGVQMPLSVQVDLRLFQRISVFSAFRRVRTKGQTTIEEPNFAEDALPLTFRMHSAKFGGTVGGQLGRVTLQAGGGVSGNWYKEEVGVLDLSLRGRNVGLLAQVAASYPLNRRLSLQGRFEFTSIPSRTDPGTGIDINLGGIELACGLLFKLFP